MYKDLSLKEKAKVLQYGGKLGLTSVEDIAKLYDDAISHKFAEGSMATPDWDPNNPYHYHTANGEKVVITPEDWEKHKGQPYFKQVEDAVLAEQAAHPRPEYIINPKFSEDLRRVYKGNMGPSYQNYSSFSGNLPQGYSFTPEGLVQDNQGNLYVQKGFRQTPRFTYDENNPLIFPVLEGRNQGNVTFYPVNMEKTVKPALPVNSTMNVNKERDKAITEYIKDNTTHSTVNGTMYKEPYFYPDIDAVDYDWEEWKKEHPVQELRRAVTKDYLYDLIKQKALNHFIFADEEGLEYDPFWSEDEQWLKDSYMQEQFDQQFNNYINKPINQIKTTDNITKRPTYAKAKKKAVIQVEPLVYSGVLPNEYKSGGPIVTPYGQWKYPGKDTIIPSNNITMDYIDYPVLGISDAGDAKVMIPWNDYKFKGSMVYEHPLIDNQFQLGGNTKPTFNQWYPTVPKQKNDTSSYDLRRAYNTLPFDELEKFRTINDYHLPSVAYDEKTDTYTFLKRNGHPTLNYELDWYNSGSPDAQEFRERYKLDTLSQPWRYIPRTFQVGGLAKKPEPIYNENGRVIGRKYVNRDNPKIIDSVVPQGRVNFQEFQKAKGKKARATNFEDLEQFQDSLIARGYNEPQRLAFLATSYNEMDNKGAASRGIGGNGYMGFNTIRMPLNLLNDSSKQIQYILDDTERLTPDNWTDGGSGGPYIKNQVDAFNKFWNETNPNTATLVLNKANIRPAKQSDWYLRASDADLMKQYMEYPELPKEEEEQKQKKGNKLLDSFVDFILSGGLQNTPSYADGGNLFKKGGIYIKPEKYILQGKKYFQGGKVIEGEFDVDDISKEEINELNRLGFEIDII